MEIMNFIILILNTLKTRLLAIMKKLWKLWKIIIWVFVGGLEIVLYFYNMKKTLSLIASIIFTVFLYFLYVVDNIVCSFGIGAKLPFKDFVELEFHHKDVYIRLFFITLILFVLWLMV